MARSWDSGLLLSCSHGKARSLRGKCGFLEDRRLAAAAIQAHGEELAVLRPGDGEDEGAVGEQKKELPGEGGKRGMEGEAELAVFQDQGQAIKEDKKHRRATCERISKT